MEDAWKAVWNEKYKEMFFDEKVVKQLAELKIKYIELEDYQIKEVFPKIESFQLKTVFENLAQTGPDLTESNLSHSRIKTRLQLIGESLDALADTGHFVDKAPKNFKGTDMEWDKNYELKIKPAVENLQGLLYDTFRKKYRELDTYQLEVAFPNFGHLPFFKSLLDSLNWIGLEMCKPVFPLNLEIMKKFDSMNDNLKDLKEMGFFYDAVPEGFNRITQSKGTEVAKKAYSENNKDVKFGFLFFVLRYLD